MTAPDVDAATAMILRGDWGDRRVFLEFATSQPECVPVVAIEAGEVVGTGVGTANGGVGWIGAIFVDEAVRRRGIGRGLTDAVISGLDDAGCRTLVLVASQECRPMYQGMGFELQTLYATLEAFGKPTDAGADGAVRAFESADLDAMATLDREATGEDRRHLLARVATAESARVLVGTSGTLDAFTVRPPWGGGATIARRIENGVRILEARRAGLGPDRKVRAGLPIENQAGVARLQELGWNRSWNAPRMIRGGALDWHPNEIWGQFAMALG